MLEGQWEQEVYLSWLQHDLQWRITNTIASTLSLHFISRNNSVKLGRIWDMRKIDSFACPEKSKMLSNWRALILTSSAIDKMFEMYTFFENRTEIRTFFENRTEMCILFENRFEIYSYILFENRTENFEHFVYGRWSH